MYKKYLVRQNGMKDCASACLLSIMKYYGLDVSLDEVSYTLKTDNNGTSAFNIINGSRTFGFDGYGIHYTLDEILNNRVSLPIICHVKKNYLLHFIVVYEVKKNYLIVMDPSTNIMKISKSNFESIYNNTSLVIYPIKKFKSKNKYKKLNGFIYDYIKLEKHSIINIIILSIIVILLGILSNYYMFILIDKVLPNYNYKYLIYITIFFLIVFLFKDIIDYIKNKILIKIENSIYTKMNISIIRKLFNLPYLFFKSKSTGEVESRINDLKVFKDLLSEMVINIFINSLFIIISLFILININYKLLLINLIQIVLYLFVIIIYKRLFIYKTNEVLESEGEYNKILNDNINSYEINKNLNLIKDKNKDIEISFIKYIYKIKSYENKLNNKLIIKNIIFDLTYIFSIFISVTYINKGIITIGELILFNSILIYLIEPFKNILDLGPKMSYINNVYRRINDLVIMKEESYIKQDINIKGDIKICNLSYSQNGYDDIFNNINIFIPFGSKYLIYGKSGSGKSTIMKILLKYLSDYKGEIFINNINLKDINIYNILNSFTYVSQNNYIINNTLKNNIVYGRSINEIEYEDVINLCNLNTLRDNNKLRNDMLIEDNGFNISGGEKQKIILARSLLKKSDFIILDEALSEVGVEEEKEIINKIFNIYNDKTIIYITHKKEIIDMFHDKYYLERRRG